MVDDPGDRTRRKRDALFAKLACDRGLLTTQQLNDAVKVQQLAPSRPLAQILMEQGILTGLEVTELQHELEAPALAPDYLPFGPFHLLREVGRGAMGVVYEARDTRTDARVAIKLVIDSPQRANPEEARFLREAELASSLPPHPHLVGVREAGTIEGKRYLVMELIEGVPLSEWRRQGSLTIRQHITLLRDVARAVHHAHQHGLIHRDLKPDNILVDANHEPHVTDFGLAKPVGGPETASMTTEGMSVGTPAYMSPEQVQAHRDIDRRTDVFSLGVILYELLTGKRPFRGDTPFEIMRKIVQEPVLPPSRVTKMVLNPVLYTNLEDICLIALAKNREQRYADAESFAEDLTRWLDGKDIHAVVPKTLRAFRARKPFRRPLAAVGFLVLLGLGALGAYHLFGPGDALPPNVLRATPVDDPSKLMKGSVLEYYSGIHFNALGVRKSDLRAAFHDPDDPAWPEGPAFYASRRWKGLLRIDATGPYDFRMETAEGGRLRIGGRNLSSAPMSEIAGRLELEEGHHELVVDYAYEGNDARLSLEWKPGAAVEFTPLTPASFFHVPGTFELRAPPEDNGPARIKGAQEGESLDVLEASGQRAVSKTYGTDRLFWRGRWSGEAHLWWATGARLNDRLKVGFQAPRTGRGPLFLALTRASDHGTFRIAVNGEIVRERLDLYHADLVTGELEFPDVPLREGANELEFTVVGSNPDAREWGPGGGLYKLGLDYIRVP